MVNQSMLHQSSLSLKSEPLVSTVEDQTLPVIEWSVASASDPLRSWLYSIGRHTNGSWLSLVQNEYMFWYPSCCVCHSYCHGQPNRMRVLHQNHIAKDCIGVWWSCKCDMATPRHLLTATQIPRHSRVWDAAVLVASIRAYNLNSQWPCERGCHEANHLEPEE